VLICLPAFHLPAGSFGSMGKGKCHVEMSMDGRYIAAGSADGSVVVWDVLGQPKRSSDGGGTPTAAGSSSPAGVTVLRYHKDAVVACAWSSDCSTLVTGDKAGQMAFWQCV
jgi:WD40 repeat protein